MRTWRLVGLVFVSTVLALLGLSERSARAEPELAASACSGYTGPVCKISGSRLYYYKTRT